jgi:hypothetical protein
MMLLSCVCWSLGQLTCAARSACRNPDYYTRVAVFIYSLQVNCCVTFHSRSWEFNYSFWTRVANANNAAWRWCVHLTYTLYIYVGLWERESLQVVTKLNSSIVHTCASGIWTATKANYQILQRPTMHIWVARPDILAQRGHHLYYFIFLIYFKFYKLVIPFTSFIISKIHDV